MEVNPTIVFRAPRVVEIENREKPTPGAGQLLIKTTRTLISIGTELAILSAGRPSRV
jgi:threonine dehydrogenase-like Zn-dependent dehydrogenase